MSEPLIDLRAKITKRTDVALEAFARAKGKDKSEVARNVLEAWAETEIKSAEYIMRVLRDENRK